MSSITQVIPMIRQLEEERVIERYAIGGVVGALDAERFQSILVRHGLRAHWQVFERTFLSGAQ